jgi:hypothetical protein
VWEKASKASTTASATISAADSQAELKTILLQSSQAVLQSLYPEAGSLA